MTQGQPAVFHLFYRSNALGFVSPKMIQDILDVARRKNEEAQVTGILILRAGHFMQLLEGPESSVRETYGRIRGDRRHTDTEVLLEFSDGARVFENWQMGYLQVKPGEGNTEAVIGEIDLALASQGQDYRRQVLRSLQLFNSVVS